MKHCHIGIMCLLGVHSSPATQIAITDIRVSKCQSPASKQASHCLQVFLNRRRNSLLEIWNKFCFGKEYSLPFNNGINSNMET